MITTKVLLDRHPGPFILLKDGVFRLANPGAIAPGRLHTLQYNPFLPWATVVAVGRRAGRGDRVPAIRSSSTIEGGSA